MLLCAMGGVAVETTTSPVAICRSDSGGPWKPIAKGVLKRTKSESGTGYALTVGEHTFTWAATRNRDDSMALTMPNSLIRALVENPKRSSSTVALSAPNPLEVDRKPVSMSLSANGEIREQSELIDLVAVIGAACPK